MVADLTNFFIFFILLCFIIYFLFLNHTQQPKPSKTQVGVRLLEHWDFFHDFLSTKIQAYNGGGWKQEGTNHPSPIGKIFIEDMGKFGSLQFCALIWSSKTLFYNKIVTNFQIATYWGQRISKNTSPDGKSKMVIQCEAVSLYRKSHTLP